MDSFMAPLPAICFLFSNSNDPQWFIKKCNGVGPGEKIKNKKQQSKSIWENVKKCSFNESLRAFREVGWESGS